MNSLIRYRYFLYGILIFLVNLILKLKYLTANDIGHDEPFSLFFAQGSPAEIIDNLIPYNNPPLFEILLHYWIDIFGLDAFEVRLFPCMISCITAVVLFFVAKKMVNERVGWWSVVFFTFSTYQIGFSHEVRTYSMFFLFSICSMYFFWQSVNYSSRKNSIGYVLFTVLLLYTHFFSLWIIFIQVIYLIIIRKLFRKEFIVSGLIIALMFSPYLIVLFQRFAESADKGTWLEPPLVSALYENIRHFSNKPLTAVFTLIFLFSGMILHFMKKINQKYYSFFLIWFFVPYLLMFAVSFYIPMFLGRYLVFLTPAFILLLAAFNDYLFQMKPYGKATAFVLPVLFIATVNLNPSNEQEPSKVAEILKPYYEKKIMIVLSPVSLDLQITYHLDRELFRYDPNYRQKEKSNNLIPENNAKNIQLPEEMIFVETPGGGYLDKERQNYKYLSSRYEEVIELKFEGEEIKAFSVFYFKNLKSELE